MALGLIGDYLVFVVIHKQNLMHSNKVAGQGLDCIPVLPSRGDVILRRHLCVAPVQDELWMLKELGHHLLLLPQARAGQP